MLHIDYSTNNHPPQLHAADDLDRCFMAILPCGEPAIPRIMRKLSGNISTGHSVISRERGVDGLLRAAQRSYPTPEDAGDPAISPPDYEIGQSGRVLELQNRDLCLRPQGMSWHFPVLVTIREEPF